MQAIVLSWPSAVDELHRVVNRSSLSQLNRQFSRRLLSSRPQSSTTSRASLGTPAQGRFLFAPQARAVVGFSP